MRFPPPRFAVGRRPPFPGPESFVGMHWPSLASALITRITRPVALFFVGFRQLSGEAVRQRLLVPLGVRATCCGGRFATGSDDSRSKILRSNGHARKESCPQARINQLGGWPVPAAGAGGSGEAAGPAGLGGISSST